MPEGCFAAPRAALACGSSGQCHSGCAHCALHSGWPPDSTPALIQTCLLMSVQVTPAMRCMLHKLLGCKATVCTTAEQKQWCGIVQMMQALPQGFSGPYQLPESPQILRQRHSGPCQSCAQMSSCFQHAGRSINRTNSASVYLKMRDTYCDALLLIRQMKHTAAVTSL